MVIYRIGVERHYTRRPANVEWPKYLDNPADALKFLSDENQPIYRSKNNKAYVQISKEELVKDFEKYNQSH